jgi:hypothetical protein
MWEIVSNFVAFLEDLNFNKRHRYIENSCQGALFFKNSIQDSRTYSELFHSIKSLTIHRCKLDKRHTTVLKNIFSRPLSARG